MRLTDRSLDQLPLLEKGQRRIRDDLLPGFGVTVGTRRKTFFVMYGKDRRLQTLGHYPAVSLKEARDEARKLLADPPRPQRTENASQRQFQPIWRTARPASEPTP